MRSLSGALCGMEALARWVDPEKGFLNPGQFINALERSRNISKLDSYMVHEIARTYRENADMGIELVPVSFNLSRLDFLECDIFREVEDAVTKYQMPRDLLRIEITETAVMSDSEMMKEQIKKFHSAGYQVWMGDFGSGYSSLNVLKDFEFDELKIDMAFMSAFTDKSRSILSKWLSSLVHKTLQKA